jgi:hypothetical protein
MTEPEWSGFLHKMGKKVKAYRRRWFELRGKTFVYYKNSSDKKPVGDILLTNAKLEADPSNLLHFKLSVVNSSRVFELKAENEEEYEQCISKLQEAIAECKDENFKVAPKSQGSMRLKKRVGKKLKDQMSNETGPVTRDEALRADWVEWFESKQDARCYRSDAASDKHTL